MKTLLLNNIPIFDRTKMSNQTKEKLRSLNSDERSYVRFINNSRRKVEIFWIDYNGGSVLHATLENAQFVDINTFVTHPWIVLDFITKENYLLNKKKVYMPKPPRILGWEQPRNRPAIMRDHVYIIQPLYSLKDLCIRMIKDSLKHDKQAFMLELPKTLQNQIANAPPRKV